MKSNPLSLAVTARSRPQHESGARRLDDLSHALIVLREFCRRKTGSRHSMRKFVACDHFGEFCQERGTGVEREGTLACLVKQASRRSRPEQARENRISVTDTG
jgi:hypothetical protein